MVEQAARGLRLTHETERQWGRQFGKALSDRIRQRAPARGDKWHLDQALISIVGKRWLLARCRGFVLAVLIQRRRDSRAEQRLMKKLLKSAGTPPRVMITDSSLHMALRCPRQLGMLVLHDRFDLCAKGTARGVA